MNINQVYILGRLTKDPEVKEINPKSKVATFRLAVNRNVKKGDEWVEKPTYIDCEGWGELANRVESSVKKGTRVLVRGRLESDEWTHKDTGEKRSKLKIYIHELQLVDKANKEATAGVPGEGNAAEGIDDLPF